MCVVDRVDLNSQRVELDRVVENDVVIVVEQQVLLFQCPLNAFAHAVKDFGELRVRLAVHFQKLHVLELAFGPQSTFERPFLRIVEIAM